MPELFDAIKDEYQFSLQKAEYTRIGTPSVDTITDVELVVKDALSVVKVTKEGIHFTFHRRLEFKPECLYSMDIIFDVSLFFKDQFKLENEQDAEFWEASIKQGGKSIIGNIASRVSMIISSIASAIGQKPIVTPPSFI